MTYRMEIDALNALIVEQRRTNELLEKLLERGSEHGMHEDNQRQDNGSSRKQRVIHGETNNDGDVQSATGRGKRGQKRNT